MDLQELQAMGAFVSNRLVKRVVAFKRPVPVDEALWAEPDVPEFTGEFEDVTMDVFIKRPSSADDLVILRAGRESQAHAAVLCRIVNEDGSRVFESMEQVQQLAGWMFLPLVNVLHEVTPAAPKAQTSIPMTPSGSRSRSRSADAPRKSGRKR